MIFEHRFQTDYAKTQWSCDMPGISEEQTEKTPLLSGSSSKPRAVSSSSSSSSASSSLTAASSPPENLKATLEEEDVVGPEDEQSSVGSRPRVLSAPPQTGFIDSLIGSDFASVLQQNLEATLDSKEPSVIDLDLNECHSSYRNFSKRVRSVSEPNLRQENSTMDAGILTALKSVKNNPYVQYVGLGLAGLVTQKEQHDEATGKPLRKTKMQLVRISAAVCGIELCYAAETAFVSPILLKLGVPTTLMTMIWCLSPMLGFFLVPIMGSLSDRCKFRLGRRRPFIIVMSIGIILGLGLVPNGELLGMLLGDPGNETLNGPGDSNRNGNFSATNFSGLSDVGISFSLPSEHFRGIIFTIIGVAMLDFNCDACQSPCRAYLLDVSVPEDHSTGLTMFTVMAGAGGSVGYIMGGIDWNATSFGEALGGHIRVVFTIVLFAFIVCVISTLTSFKEIPLSEMHVTREDMQRSKKKVGKSKYKKFTNEDSSSENEDAHAEHKDIERGAKPTSYGAVSKTTGVSSQYKSKSESNLQNGGPSKQKAFAPTNWDNEGSGRLNVQTNLDSQTSRGRDLDFGRQTERVGTNSPRLQSSIQTDESSASNQENQSNTGFQQMNGYTSSIHSASSESQSNHQNKIHRDSRDSQNTRSLQLTSSNSYGGQDEINPYAKNSANAAGCDDTTQVSDVVDMVEVSTDVTLKTYLASIVRMPRSMWVLCLCNLFCWMSLVCYSLYFTDFVGQAVYGGDPLAPVGSDLHNRYDAGVRLGSFGMSLYSLSCACYSLVIEKCVQKFRAKRVYVLGQLVFTVGMAVMAASRSKIAVIVLSPCAGIMYATLFTMPYLLVAHYHTRGVFSHGNEGSTERKQVRGLGTDVAIVSSMVFLAQFILSVIIGTMVTAVDSTVTVVIASSILSFLGSITATQVTYLDL